ncbi:MAG: DUF2892 domain-containing protein [Gammaproteobacteria bacterium]|nr:DUF2892 domain-containing protein [Gammaproteobacteria bacterium]
MQNNVGKTDKLIRTIVALIIAALYFTGTIEGTVAAVLGIIAIIFVVTSLVGTCPIYLILKLSSKK